MSEQGKMGWLQWFLGKPVATDITAASQTRPVRWEDVEAQLPDTIRQQTGHAKGTPITNPWIQSGLHGLLGAAPSLYTAMESGKYLEIVGPPEALSGTFGHMVDSQGNILGGLVNEKGRLVGQTRFKDAAGSLSAAATAAVAFQVLSVATSQYYLHQISASLEQLNEKVDALNCKIEHRQWGEILAAVEVIDEIYYSNINNINATGQVDWQVPDKVEFWTRMSNTEQALRGNVRALELEIFTKIQEISNSVREKNERIKESYNTHRKVIKDLEAIHHSDSVYYYLLALRGMMRWYQLVLSFDCHSQEVIRKGRYDAMIRYVKDRCEIMQKLSAEHQFILIRPDGTSWKDELIAGGLTALGTAAGFFVPGGVLTTWLTGSAVYNAVSTRRDLRFEQDREKSLQNLDIDRCDLFSTMIHFKAMETSLVEPRTFYLKADDDNNVRELRLEIADAAA